jgi:glycosyltransferase involved in cell wall biosynthesis
VTASTPNSPQRVLLVALPNAFAQPGGAKTQVLFTKRALESAGVMVDIAATLAPDARGYDLAHVFGVYDPEDAQQQVEACTAAGVPTALSPMWWDLYDFFGRSRGLNAVLAGPEKRIPAGLQRLKKTKTDRLLRPNERRKYAVRSELQRTIMRTADVLLPNSSVESFLLRKTMRLADRPMVVVHHAVDVPIGNHGSRARSGVLCVGRIEPMKNQAALLYALRDLDVDVSLVGACYEPEYFKIVERYLGSRRTWVGELTRQEALDAMSRAAVHVLPSMFEFPGLVSLEAGAMGARVVAAVNGTEGEYLGDCALYLDPEDPASIRAAVERALALPPRRPGDEFDRRLAGFTERSVAENTLRGYDIAMKSRPH